MQARRSKHSLRISSAHQLAPLVVILGLCLSAMPGYASPPDSTPLGRATPSTPSTPSTPPTVNNKQPRLRWLVFFATWCVPCRLELARASEIARKWRGRGLELTLVSEDGPESAAMIPAFLRRAGATAPWIRDAESRLLVRHHPAASVPFAVLLDPAGQVVFARSGYEPGDERRFEAAIAGVLRPRGATTSRVSPRQPHKTGLRADHELEGWRTTASLVGLGVMRTSRFDPTSNGRLQGAVARLEGNASNQRVDLGLRLDGVYLHRPTEPGRPGESAVGKTSRDARIERAWAAGRWGPASIRLGDQHVAFGEGLTLSLRRIDTLGVDQALRGGALRLGDERLSVRLLGGRVNRQNLDPVELSILQDNDDVLAGVEADERLGTRLRWRQYGLWARAPRASPSGEDLRWLLAGTALTWADHGHRAAVEIAGGKQRGRTATPTPMFAGYARVQLALGSWTTLLEARLLRAWQFGRPGTVGAWSEAPTLERADQVVPGNADSAGVRARVDRALTPTTHVYGAAMLARTSLDGAPVWQSGVRLVHLYAGATHRFGQRGNVGISAGWRDERIKGSPRKSGLAHAEVDLALRLPAAFALAVKVNHRQEQVRRFSGLVDFVRSLGVASVSWRQRWVISGLYGWSTEVAARPVHYPAVELRAVLPRGGEVRLFYGRMAGGRVCVSGACRDLPAFEGGRIDLVLRY